MLIFITTIKIGMDQFMVTFKSMISFWDQRLHLGLLLEIAENPAKSVDLQLSPLINTGQFNFSVIILSSSKRF